jgi:stringent starvation protein B
MSESVVLTSTKPYLVRAIFEWIVDNQCTPYIIVNAEARDVEVPRQYVQEGRIILNISENAVRDLQISNDFLEFNARFNGVATQVYTPVSAIIAIYAHENGQGMIFNEDETNQQPEPPSTDPDSDHKKTVKRPDPHVKPVLRVIK